jgi:hypothetical protein
MNRQELRTLHSSAFSSESSCLSPSNILSEFHRTFFLRDPSGSGLSVCASGSWTVPSVVRDMKRVGLDLDRDVATRDTSNGPRARDWRPYKPCAFAP